MRESPANPSRRGLLAAMAVAPVIVAVPAAALAAPRAEWEQAVAQFHALNKASETHRYLDMLGNEPDCEAAHEAFNETCDRRRAAERAVLRMPPPDHEALAEKIEIMAIVYEGYDMGDVFDAFARDARLLGK